MHIGRNRTMALAVAAVGVVLIVAGWAGEDGNWESVFINVGTALALVVVLILVEDKWRAGADERIERVSRDVRDVRAFAETIAEAQARQQMSRTEKDRVLINAWKADPGPESLWAIRQRCEALGLSVPETVLLGNVAINFFPEENSIQLTINPEPASSGAPSSERFHWNLTQSLAEVIEWMDEAMVRLRIHPGAGFQMADVIERLGDAYAARISAGFNGFG